MKGTVLNSHFSQWLKQLVRAAVQTDTIFQRSTFIRQLYRQRPTSIHVNGNFHLPRYDWVVDLQFPGARETKGTMEK